MFLVLDFGNTNKKLALFEAGKLKLVEQYGEINRRIVLDFIHNNPGITHAILSAVVDYPASIRKYLEKQCSFLELDHNTPLPVINRYKSPDTLGNDRLAAAVAGVSLAAGKPVLVANCGTCITYDFVEASGIYRGGAISPGIRMRFEALHTFTGKLPLIEMKNRTLLTGRNTEESILSGVLTGAVAEMDGIISRYKDVHPDLLTVLSGGDWKYFYKRLKSSIFALPNIVLHGLHHILLYNVNR